MSVSVDGCRRAVLAIAVLCLSPMAALGQDDFEIQVYPSETVRPGMTMIELHSNWTGSGTRTRMDGVVPSNHAFHETLEVTEGFTDWFETGFYLFTSIQPGEGWAWVGDHVRPRVRAPEEWEWPVGVSLSTEVGYQRRAYSTDTWTWELRPIVDKQWGPWYVSINPAVEKSLEGGNSREGWAFTPAAKVSFDVTSLIALGVEYYASLGPIDHWNPRSEQQHQVFPTIDLNFSPEWEFNFGVGYGLTRTTDDRVVKLILGRRF